MTIAAAPTAPRLPGDTGRRLLPYLLAALVLHLALLFGLRLPPAPGHNGAPTRLQVLARPLPAPAARTAPNNPRAATGAEAAAKPNAHEQERFAPLLTAPADSSGAGFRLYDAARQQARNEVREGGTAGATDNGDRRRALANNFNRPTPPGQGLREETLSDGLIKFTRPDGSSYCIQRPPDYVGRDTPINVTIPTTTCGNR